MTKTLFTFPEFLAIGTLSIVEIIFVKHSQLSFYNISGIALLVLALLIIASIYGKNGRSLKLAQMAYYGAAMIASGVAGLILSYLAAHQSYRLFDAEYAAIDSAMGFSLPKWFFFLNTWPFLDQVLKLAYASLLLQLSFSIIYFSHTLQIKRNKELFWIVFVSSIITSAISTIFPALGPFHHYNFSIERALHLQHVSILRSQVPAAFSVATLEGIIALPSYHTVLAFVFSYLHRGHRFISPAMILLNVLMLVATPTHGGHYFVDIFAGALVAIGSIMLVRQLTKRSNELSPILPRTEQTRGKLNRA